MIVDASALVAILRSEAESELFVEIIDAAPVCRMSAVNYFETAIVVDSARDAIASRRLDELIRVAGILIEPVDRAQAVVAREAYRDFGKGSGHQARLNMGDCFAYALAKERDEPMLFKGNDFSQTDITAAI